MIRAAAAFLRRHPYPVGGVYLFALFMTFAYMPYDFLLKPFWGGIDAAEEVWLGYRLRGWPAKLTEPAHWAIYASLAHGLHHERPWAWTFGSLYTVQVAVASLVWVILYADYGPVGYALTPVVVGLFLLLALRLWQLRPSSSGDR